MLFGIDHGVGSAMRSKWAGEDVCDFDCEREHTRSLPITARRGRYGDRGKAGQVEVGTWAAGRMVLAVQRRRLSISRGYVIRVEPAAQHLSARSHDRTSLVEDLAGFRSDAAFQVALSSAS